MDIIKCNTCGAQFNRSEGRCPVCRNLPDESLSAPQPSEQKPSSAARVKKRFSPKSLLSYKAFKLLVCIAAAAVILLPLGRGAYIYYTSPQAQINRGDYKKAYKSLSRRERESIVEDMLRCGRYGTAYDMVKTSEREDIYLESRLAYFVREAYNVIAEKNGVEIPSGTYRLTDALHGVSEDFDMFVVELRLVETPDDALLPSDCCIFFADDGELVSYKTATDFFSLEETLGISLGGYSSGYDTSDDSSDYDYGYDEEVNSLMLTEYSGARLGYIDEQMIMRVNTMAASGLCDSAEYLGRDKMP